MSEAQQLKILKDILQQLHEQGDTIHELKNESILQKERIDEQDQTIANLTTKVEELSLKSVGTKDEDTNNSIWKDTASLSIADVVKEEAEKSLMSHLGFVFDTKSNLYCNYSTGYYYYPTQELFYNGQTGTYYTYDVANAKYKFHSQIELESPPFIAKAEKPKNKYEKGRHKDKECRKTKSTHKGSTSKVKDESEEGEISGSEDDGDSSPDSNNIYNSEESNSVDDEFPPCIRAIILESGSSDIKKGALFVVTCMGGTIGREGDDNAILLPHPSVKKIHAKIVYQCKPDENEDLKPRKHYYIIDMGSSTGTFLNGNRLSEPFQRSDFAKIVHGSVIKIGDFSILCHIHPGSFTCGHCEPGLLIEPEVNDTVPTPDSKPKTRNALMKQIKKKYGIDKPQTAENLPDSTSYNDRSRERRVVKGSDNPYEKTQVTTAEESISETNKGFKMLSKMGWSTGKSLGNTGDKGLLEPIKLDVKSDRAGLGMMSQFAGISVKVEPSSFPSFNTGKKKGSKNPPFIPKHQQRADQLAKTMKRFKEAGNSDLKMETDNNVDMDENSPNS